MVSTGRIAKSRTEWEDILLICRKCAKRGRGGFGNKGRKRLDKYLRESLDLGKGRKARIDIVMTPCFKVCPKNGVTVARGDKADTLFVVPHGMEASEIAEALEIAPAKGEVHAFIDWPFGKRSAA